MFFENEPLNDIDDLYLALPEEDRDGVTAKTGKTQTKDGEEALHCRFDIVLKRV